MNKKRSLAQSQASYVFGEDGKEKVDGEDCGKKSRNRKKAVSKPPTHIELADLELECHPSLTAAGVRLFEHEHEMFADSTKDDQGHTNYERYLEVVKEAQEILSQQDNANNFTP